MSTSPPPPPEDVPDDHVPPEKQPRPHEAQPAPDDSFDDRLFDDSAFDTSALIDGHISGEALANNGDERPRATPAALGSQGEPRNNIGTTSLVCGLASIILSMIPILNLVTWPLGGIAVVFGAIGWNLANKGEATNKSYSVYGLATGLASFFITCGMYTGSNPTTPSVFGG
ncbi:hypothetical protein [Natronoglycomyces albus]|uniref:DUF4190 domain-containing protein n=1 Tax=Natronoglycomyces albus TaxID=2811108 RepID=A0A895XSZ0_9ACTN|nr:hypothetical protein [Natronoglycomyces albus]QSB05656.1 hypothetical protein JQS30_01630 [Natronoglycomyces albus]